MKIGYKTHIGMIREHNEDAYLVIDDYYPKFCVFAVADGMGGHNAGEVASKIAIDCIKDFFVDNHNNDELIFNIRNIKHKIEKINSFIYQKSQNKPELNGMGTTLTVALAFSNKLYIFHIGDSRAYRINHSNIKLLTEDHSLVAELVKKGKITEEEAINHPQKNVITRALGTEEYISPDFYNYQINSKDVILLCTDGLFNSIPEDKILSIINEDTNFQLKAERLISLANDSGGKDNITTIIFQG